MLINYNYKIENLRALAIIIVLLGHSIIIYDSNWGLYNTENTFIVFEYLKKLINLIQMPLFISISGYLLYNRLDLIDKKRFLKNKFIRLIVPFCFFSIFYLLPIRLFLNYPGYKSKGIIYNLVVNIFLGKDCGHLWFLPTLFGMFFVFCFMKKKYISDKLIPSFIVISILGTLFFPSYIGYIFKYSLYFYFGILINKYNCDDERRKKNIFLVITTITLLLYFFIKNILISILFEIIIALEVCLLLFLIIPNKKNNILSKISRNSFGMYLIHSPLIYISFTFFPNIFPIFMLLINFCGFGLVSYFMTSLIRKTKIKFIIGE